MNTTTSTAPPPAPMSLNVMVGVPDDRGCIAKVQEADGKLLVSMKGAVDVRNYLPAHLFACRVIHLDPGSPHRLVVLGHGPLLNQISDPDRCALTLKRLDDIVVPSGRACFNTPSAVLKSGRDTIATALDGIVGLVVPAALRIVAQEPDALAAAVAAKKMEYPILVRVAGDHGGISILKIDSPAQMARIRELNCYNKPVYITQFVDFASSDGRYRKYRIAVVGERIFLRHMIVGDNWLLHAGRRGENTAVDEANMLRTFQTELGPRLQPLFCEIGKRLDLDYFGMDCNVLESGEVLLFEANASMDIMANTSPSPNMWDEPIADIKAAVIALLRTPQLWRHPARNAPKNMIAVSANT